MGDGHDSGKVLDIKTADIKSVAPVFKRQGKELSSALTELITILDGLGEPWGEDAKKFGTDYLANVRSMESSAGILVLGLVSVHEALSDMADGHVDNDEAIAGIFTKEKAGPGKGGR
ncbi:hypothetical protein AB0I22_17855 [Streptomyces sp. NPDC050610]|uniref:hypothetical protein n=1 Tax=Streptomyces sp. NPDC050610 TaxID=3157097 RepID=UPI00341ACE02